MSQNINIEEFVRRFTNGEYNNKDRKTQILAGWYDWFCKDSSLANKTKFLGNKVVAIADSDKFDKNKCYVFFKNNCPCVGPLYDDFRICDIETGDVIFCCQHLQKGSHGCDKTHWEIYDVRDATFAPKVNGTWRDVYKFFMNK